MSDLSDVGRACEMAATSWPHHPNGYGHEIAELLNLAAYRIKELEAEVQRLSTPDQWWPIIINEGVVDLEEFANHHFDEPGEVFHAEAGRMLGRFVYITTEGPNGAYEDGRYYGRVAVLGPFETESQARAAREGDRKPPTSKHYGYPYCERCKGAGWHWGHEGGVGDFETDNRYTCELCEEREEGEG